MTYALGMDVGTTFTAAGVWRDGIIEAVGLGNRSHVIPSVLFVTDDGSLLVGEPAVRRAVLQPGRVGREFKRGVGDRVPVRLGDRTFTASVLMVEVARWVLGRVAEREGGPPSSLVMTVPATWGSYRRDLLADAVAALDLTEPATLLEEPVAAALHYASQERIPPGAVVGVYDLGGGTFDATVLRKTKHGFELAGPAQGDDRLGGLDLDQVVVDHIARTLGSPWTDLDPSDPPTVQAVTHVRAQAAEAKEALSADIEVVIPVVLPTGTHEVRLTRGEFEQAIEGPLLRSVETLERAVHAASVTADDLHAVLLVGGSSRIPLVSQLIVEHLGARVALDAHPKFAVCLGAAVVAGSRIDPAAEPLLRPGPASDAPDPTVVAGAAAVARAGSAADGRTERIDTAASGRTEETPTQRTHEDATERIDVATADATTTIPPVDDATTTIPPAPPSTGPPPEDVEHGGRRLPTVPLAVAGALVAALVVAVLAWPDGGDPGPGESPTDTPTATDGPSAPESEEATQVPPSDATTPDASDPAGTPTLAEVLDLVGPVAWVLTSDDGPVVQVLSTPDAPPISLVGPAGDGRQPAISPDGQRVAFVSGEAGSEQVLVAPVDGSGDATPVDGLPTPSFEPAWSPDGERLAVATQGADGRVAAVLDLASGELTEVTTGAVFDQRPTWSPDGQRIAFHRILQGNADVFVVPADGSGEATPLAATAGSESHPTWSPDGTRVAYSSLADGIPAVFVVEVDGGTPRRLWPDLFEGQAAPVWTSADVIVYEGGDRGAENIYASPVDGSWVVEVEADETATNDPGLVAGR